MAAASSLFRERTTGRRRARERPSATTVPWATMAAVVVVLLAPAAAPAQPGNLFDDESPAADAQAADAVPDAAEPPAALDDAAVEPGVFLPGDRGRERLLDRARRLTAEERWSDAAAAIDELLAIERDVFVASGAGTTRRSIRSEAAALVERLPRAGRDAYEHLFSGRAEKRLAAAIAADDAAGIVAVARRWLHTPAGRQAALICAVRAMEAGQPMAAAAWLDRLATTVAMDLEPTLSVMRAAAHAAAGDDVAAPRLAEAGRRGRSGLRLGGRDTTIPADAEAAGAWLREQGLRPATPSTAGRDWPQLRGDPRRNGIVEATRPLLVPRYRVPLVRHPEEARRLEKHRQAEAAAGRSLRPAGTPVAVGDRVVVQTPLGILAIDFESGRRVWLESAVSLPDADAAEERSGATPPVLSDATGGNLASDGRLVFAVEIRPEAIRPARAGVTGFGRVAPGPAAAWEQGNTLSAYDLRDGAVRWRLPAGGGAAEEDAATAPWHLGPPLVVGDELFLLVEDKGDVRVEVRAAADGELRWLQPLATYEEGDAISGAAALGRRLAGLTPALAEGVLVCPIGGGCVVAIDVATRSLLWAHAYQRPAADRDRVGFGVDAADDRDDRGRPGEPAPLIASDRVVVAPFDTDRIICLRLRDGTPLWQRPRTGGLAIAGAVSDRLLLIDEEGAEAVDLGTGRRIWKRGLGEGVRPSGRSVLTPRSLLVPGDAPAVVEIALADGGILGRSVPRGGGIPGNLVAHRGEVVSRGIDSLDVFHQEAALDRRIETARRTDPRSPWAAYWSGQVAIEAGDVDGGLIALAEAAGGRGFRIPPGQLSAAVVEAMRRDFPAAAARWESFPGDADGRSSPDVDRMTVDGSLSIRDARAAWPALRRLLVAVPDPAAGTPATMRDPFDPRLWISADRWLQSRLDRLTAAADEPLRREIERACDELVAAIVSRPDDPDRRRRLATACRRLGRRPAADAAREALGSEPDGDRQPAVGEELLALEAMPADAPARQPVDAVDPDAAWPLGQVERRDFRGGGDRDATGGPSQVRPVPLVTFGGPRTLAAHAAIDVSRQQLAITDRFGRPLSQPLRVTGLAGGFGLQFVHQSGAIELAAMGPVVFVRSGTGVAAYRLGATADAARPLWDDPDLAATADEPGARWGGRVARDGAAPLGLRVGEADDRPRGGGRGMTVVPGGLVVPAQRSITVVDPVAGEVHWERRQLPPGLEWFVDGQFLCGCTVDGRGSLVLSMLDGRLLHTFDVPHRRQRVAALGRRFVAVQPLDEPHATATASRVRLELVDPADRETRDLGTFAGQARATDSGDGRLAVLEPGGLLTVFDLADGGVVFRRELPAIPRSFERLAVQPWQDRYLVVVGTGSADEPQGVDVSPLEPLLFGGGAAAPLSGVVWAVQRSDGRPLWQSPAIIERHCLHTAQPRGLPVLAFCRILQPRTRGLPSLSVLLLDKRTGHAVLEDDRIRLEAPAGGCDLRADPGDHALTVQDAGSPGARLVLSFTGRPMAPRPPFQSRGRPPALVAGADLLDGAKDERTD